MRVVAIIQARLESTRLPGKVLMDIGGRTMLAWVVQRTRRAETVDQIVVATTDSPADDAVVAESERLEAQAFRGSREDVLERYHKAAGTYAADVIVRITADCPLLDPKEVDRVVRHLLEHPGLDYTGTGETYPEGYGVEAFRRSALEVADREAGLSSEREHVTPFLWKNANRFALKRLELPEDLSDFRVTVDEDADLRVVRTVVEALAPEDSFFGIDKAVAFLRAHPEIASLNSHVARQAGYWKSVAEDTSVRDSMGHSRRGGRQDEARKGQ